jgi:molybdopterin molybdotransferase
MTPATRTADFERRSADWLDVDSARARVLARAAALEPERVAIGEAIGRALAEQVVSSATLPPWDNSAMDGYAVRAEDVAGASPDRPVALDVVGVARAGQRTETTLGPGQAIRIMTGAPVPPGADTVVRVEDSDAEAQPGVVRIREGRDRGRHVRGAGRDMLEGEVLLSPGHAITPGAVGLLAAAGRDRVLVHGRPTVAILSTGDELRTADRYEDVRAGLGVPDSNGPMLAAMVRAAGAHPVPLGIAEDDRAELTRLVTTGAECDVLVTVGGASMGDADLVKRVLDELGFEQDFWRVKMRPGSPFGFGSLPVEGRGQHVFSLPGNPASAFVTFEVFARPFLLALAGHLRVHRRTVLCRSADTIRVPAPLTHFHRVGLSETADGLVARLTGSQGSGLVSGLARADGLAVIPPAVDAVEPGDPVTVVLLDGAREMGDVA